MNYCQKNCYGVPNYGGSCCTVSNRDWIIGPISDTEETLERVRKLFPGLEVNRSDLFISFDEGSKLFPEKETWQNPDHYPCMRVNTNSNEMPCIFFNEVLKCCQIYDDRPKTCSNYKCDHLRQYELDNLSQP